MLLLTKITSIFQIILGLFMALYHLATIIPWYMNSLSVYGTHSLFLVAGDLFILGLGILGVLIGFQVGKIKNDERTATFMYTGGCLFVIPTIAWILAAQGAVEFSLTVLYSKVLIFPKTMTAQTKLALLYLDPAFSFAFMLLTAIVAIISLVAAVKNVKRAVPQLFDGSGVSKNVETSEEHQTSYVAFNNKQ
ncbi:predicted protein [Naegleria gruberi]|uniref:Predicted protein n=1 Tax=Naegleria gruberi TaxID=5762 RepID=D2V1G2_NAEGR|nr:uncharacterized protein NAEGRDRAFT_62568 [Naegleria gruberi]EFC49160.1 predicted protein [Naegleria gruberi]|eukprot:XP_002681904.1 predicted protein [Naegleria gruberi strain NEG-M]